MNYELRKAIPDDQENLRRLISCSARQLGARDYRREQIGAALHGAFGVDTQLINDGTYFVAQMAGGIAGCGGWSMRRTLFGGDSHAERDDGMLDPTKDAARIRAFFVHPDFARRGLGRALLVHCESKARLRGFRKFELMSTLTGVPLYQACGYEASALVRYPVAARVVLELVPMHKKSAI